MKQKRPGRPTGGDKPQSPRLEIEHDIDRGAAVSNAATQTAQMKREFAKRKRQQLARAAVELDRTDTEILRVFLSHPSMTQKAIAHYLGLSRATINFRMNTPKFKRAMEVANRSAVEIYNGNQARAARKLAELIDSPDHYVALRACVAHLWPIIHGKPSSAGEDFVSFVQEAFEQAEATKQAIAGKSASVVDGVVLLRRDNEGRDQ